MHYAGGNVVSLGEYAGLAASRAKAFRNEAVYRERRPRERLAEARRYRREVARRRRAG
jgi:hypothetical protein